jgi:hypothetical protein
MAKLDGTWECPTCQMRAKVAGRNVTIVLAPSLNPHWPLHRDCELAKDLDHIDFGKLSKVG